MNIGNRIYEMRKEKKLSQEKLAERVGVTRQTISNWELNESSPDLKQAKELSTIFNISLDELVNNDIQNILLEKTAKSNIFMTKLNKTMFGIFLSISALLITMIISVFYTNRSIDTRSSGYNHLTCFCEIGDNSVFFRTNEKNYNKIKEMYEKDGGHCYNNK